MKIRFRLHPMIGRRARAGEARAGDVDLPGGATVEDLLARLGLDGPDPKIVFVNRKRQKDRAHMLADGDEVTVFPMLGGG